jgi:hypothetical protein
MNEPNPSCAQSIAQELASRERTFADIWRRVADDGKRAAVFRALDPLGLEGEPVISVRFNAGVAMAWLEIQLSEQAPGGVSWVTYHCAGLTGHAERLVTETRAPALFLAATYYADFVAHQLRNREVS